MSHNSVTAASGVCWETEDDLGTRATDKISMHVLMDDKGGRLPSMLEQCAGGEGVRDGGGGVRSRAGGERTA